MKLSSLRAAENAPVRYDALDWQRASRRGPPGLSAFQFGCLLAMASTLVTILAGCLTHSILLFGQPWGWPELLLVGVGTIAIGLFDACACDTDPEAVLEAILQRQEALGVVPAVLALALACLCLFGWLGRAEMEARLLWAAAFLLSTALGLWAVSLGAPRAARVMRPMRLTLIGKRAAQRELLGQLAARPFPLQQIVAAFDPTAEHSPAVPGLLGLPSLDLLVAQIRAEAVDAVLIDPAGLRPSQIEATRQRLHETPIEIRLVSRPMACALPAGPILLGASVPQRRIRPRRLCGWSAVAKRAEDLALGVLLLLGTLPVLALIALAVKIDSPGPILFRQRRYGWNNRTIEVLKFRTMRHDRQDVEGSLQAMPGDDRVTRVGRILRRFSLDELPQIANVLGGSMSVVGPRPHALHTRAAGILFENAVASYAARHNVKPGITGLAQIRGWRGPTTSVAHLEERVQSDLEYIQRWSLGLDLVIVIGTIPAMLRATNAC